VKLIRNLPDIVDRYVEDSPPLIPETNKQHSHSKAPYTIAAFIASIGLLFPLCTRLNVFKVHELSVFYVPIVALVLAALVTIAATLK
jgi:hypothetical protein